jgi:cation diffusion facilitator family transporter
MSEAMISRTKISERRVLVTTFWVDFLDVVLNLSVAILTGSVIMLSEFFQGLADLTAAAFLMVGYKRSRKKEDSLHPFGHGKEIYFWTLISAVVMMTFTATASFYFGLIRFLSPQEITHIGFAYGTLLVTLVTNAYALSLSYRRLMKNKPLMQLPQAFLHSNVVTTKNALVLDLMGTTAACFGLVSLLLYQLAGEERFDGLGAMIIGATTAILAFVLIIGIKGLLVGERAEPQIEEKIKNVALSVPQVKEVLDLRTMQIGSDKLLVNIDVHMQDGLTTDELEALIDKIKKRIREKVSSVRYVQVELETPE